MFSTKGAPESSHPEVLQQLAISLGIHYQDNSFDQVQMVYGRVLPPLEAYHSGNGRETIARETPNKNL
ncbi:hypothetical protein TIFTF001_016484 [Ficus carica]|uniref:Uncharacterized protein n=1 Tax=Ficus carica TaxID=3494 RepID=A0AA88ANR5_FICCA|nr:hypothetical protein TIFTF001_016484 [Ficus carica]